MKRMIRLFAEKVPRYMLGDMVPAEATVTTIYMTDMLRVHCADLSPSWFFEALENRVDGLEDEAQEELETELNLAVEEDCGYRYVWDAERLVACCPDQEIEIDDADLEGLTPVRVQVAFLQKAREEWNANPWA